MAVYDDIKQKQSELIRKALDGSFFIAGISAPDVDSLTEKVGSVISLKQLPQGYEDVGWITADGMQFGRETSSNDITSFGSTTPTRSDIQSDVTSMTINAQETKARTLALSTGADIAAIKANPVTGEVVLTKPSRPSSRQYKGLWIAIDDIGYGEIYMARFFANLKVTAYGEETYQSGDQAILRSVTLGTNPGKDGWAERWLFGGPGWDHQLDAMGIDRSTP